MLTMIESARHVCKVIHDAGYEAYFVGGCVRDTLLGRSPKDIDIASSAKPEDIARIFSTSTFAGKSFGVSRVRHEDYEFEVATFRSDGEYSDGRRPDSVTYATLEEDVMRRDFTMNALMMHPITGEIIDLVGGKTDIAAKIVRTVGDPLERFKEDKLRMLRAVRFATTLGFQISPGTADAIIKMSDQISFVSKERITQELFKAIGHNVAITFRHLSALKLSKHLFTEGEKLGSVRWILREKVYDDFHKFDEKVRFAIGCSHIIFTLLLSDDGVKSFLKNDLMLSNEQLRIIEVFNRSYVEICDHSYQISRLNKVLYGEYGKEIFLSIRSLISPGYKESISRIILESLVNPIDKSIIPNGHHFISRGLEVGPAIGTAILNAEYAVYGRRAKTTEEAIEAGIKAAHAICGEKKTK